MDQFMLVVYESADAKNWWIWMQFDDDDDDEDASRHLNKGPTSPVRAHPHVTFKKYNYFHQSGDIWVVNHLKSL